MRRSRKRFGYACRSSEVAGVKLRAGYGRQEVTYPFFGEYEIKSFQNLVLRNSGQDRDGARVRDAVCMRMVEGLNIDNCATRPVVAYINGKYWGIYDLNEDQNADFLAAHYGVNPDEVDNIIRRNTGALEGSSADIKRVRDSRAAGIYQMMSCLSSIWNGLMSITLPIT